MTETAFFPDHTATPPATQIGGLSFLSSGCFAYACPAAIGSLPTAGSRSIVYGVAPLENVFGLEKLSVNCVARPSEGWPQLRSADAVRERLDARVVNSVLRTLRETRVDHHCEIECSRSAIMNTIRAVRP